MKHFTSNKTSKKIYGKIKCANNFRKMISVILAMTFILSMAFPVMANQENSETMYILDEAISDFEPVHLFDETQAIELFEPFWENTIVLDAAYSERRAGSDLVTFGERAADDLVTIVFNNNGFDELIVPGNITVESGSSFVLNYEVSAMYLDGFEFKGWFYPEMVEVVLPGQVMTVTGSGVIELFAVFEPIDTDMRAAAFAAMNIPTIIHNPRNDEDVVPHRDLTVRWAPVFEASTYLLSLRDLNTYRLRHYRVDTRGATSFTVDSMHFVAGHRFRVAVGTVPANRWAHRYFWVESAAPSPTLSVSDWTWNAGAGIMTSHTMTITSNTQWQIRSDQSWLAPSRASGTGPAPFTLSTTSANPNSTPRTATVSIWATNGGGSHTIHVTQAAMSSTLTVSPTTWNAGSGAVTSPNKTINSNTSWFISSNQPWLAPSRTSGFGNMHFTLSTTSANPSTTTQRHATVTIWTADGVARTVTVTQAAGQSPGQPILPAPTLTVSHNRWNAVAVPSTSPVMSITSSTSWTINSNQGWLVPSITHGSSNMNFTLSTNSANPNTTSRTAIVTITTADRRVSRTIEVEQAGRTTLTLNTEAWNPTSAASNTSITVTSNTTWNVSVSSDATSWLSVSNITSASFRVNARANTEAAAQTRRGTITVTGGGVTRTIRVTQDGEFIWYATKGSPVDDRSAPYYWVAYWTGAITVSNSPEIPGVVPDGFVSNLNRMLHEARSKWSEALAVPIGIEDTQASATIQVFGGSLRDMQIESGFFYNFAGAANVPCRRGGGNPITIDNIQRTLHVFPSSTEQAQIYITFGLGTGNWTEHELRVITVHELGHALGWAGHSTYRRDVMYYSLHNDMRSTISETEARHLRQIYDRFRHP